MTVNLKAVCQRVLVRSLFTQASGYCCGKKFVCVTQKAERSVVLKIGTVFFLIQHYEDAFHDVWRDPPLGLIILNSSSRSVGEYLDVLMGRLSIPGALLTV